jgi:hypothetical protein
MGGLAHGAIARKFNYDGRVLHSCVSSAIDEY